MVDNDNDAAPPASDPGDPGAQPDAPAKPSRRSPNRVGADLVAKSHFVTDKTGTVYQYVDGRWLELAEVDLAQIAGRADGSLKSSGHRVSEIVKFIRRETYSRTLEWGRVADHEVAAANGVVDIRTGALRPHRPEDYLEYVVAVPYAPGAQAPTLQAALATWFGSPTSSAARALQEFFGYVVCSHAKYKKALVLKGPGNSGKSIVPWLAQQLVGAANCAQLSVEHMDDPTRRAVLKGKALNVITDLSSSAVIADGGFKTLVSTEEPILIDQKYKPAETYTPRSKHIIATNVLPRMSDRFEEILDRLLIVPMPREIAPEKRDENLKPKLLAELDGVLAWAIEGGRRLFERGGRFEAPQEAAAILAEMRDDTNPIRAFLDEMCVADLNGAIPLSVLAHNFNRWQAGGHRRTERQIGKMARQAGQTIKRIRYRERVVVSIAGWRLAETDTPKGLVISDADALAEGDDATAIEPDRGPA